ncbi:MAG: hypothetical protein ABR581_04165 [Thermoleophilaceae bacterium]
MPLFCRHNRHTADCPICSKGTVLDAGRSRGPASRSDRPRRQRAGGTPAFRGPFAAAGPYEDDEGRYEVRLERVPGGLRLAAWQAGAIRRQAPVLAAEDLTELIREGERSQALVEDEAASLLRAVASGPGAGASPGCAGELREELRAEDLPGGRLRIARWVLRPGSGWELQQAPVMYPAPRYAEALAAPSGRPRS